LAQGYRDLYQGIDKSHKSYYATYRQGGRGEESAIWEVRYIIYPHSTLQFLDLIIINNKNI